MNSTNPNDVSCLTTHRVIQFELSPITSSSSALLRPSLLFPMAAIAGTRCCTSATFLRTFLWALGSEGQSQRPVFTEPGEPGGQINPLGAGRFNRFYSVINCFLFGWTSKRNYLVISATMEVVTEYADQRTELEEKIRSLEADKASLLAGIASLKEKIATYELERSATALEGEVEALRTEKAVLDEKAATYEAEAGYNLPPVGTEGI